MDTNRLHTITEVIFDRRFDAFRDAAAGGGTQPQWTECHDGAGPADWRAPADAAGGLVVWDEDGCVDRLEPPIAAPGAEEKTKRIAETVLRDLNEAGLTVERLEGIIRATYASCGGRVVALVEQTDRAYVAVLRGEATPRHGASEDNLAPHRVGGDGYHLEGDSDGVLVWGAH